MSRVLKQFIYSGIYLSIALLIAWPIYRFFNPAATCTDTIQNGTEEGVDCGAVCGVSCAVAVKPLEQRDPIIIQTGPSSYDILAHLENPNATYGASRVDYVLTVTDASGAQLALRPGVTYVNPSQPRYLLFPFQGLKTVPAHVDLNIVPTDVEWGSLSIEAAGDVQFSVRSDQLVTASGSVEYSASILNKSKFNFDAIDVTILVYDAQGIIIGANSTVLRTFVAGEERGIHVVWPFSIPRVIRAEAVVTTNVFANDNFIKTYGSQERFQGF